jgi:hypothetical protein
MVKNETTESRTARAAELIRQTYAKTEQMLAARAIGQAVLHLVRAKRDLSPEAITAVLADESVTFKASPKSDRKYGTAALIEAMKAGS